MPPKGHFPRAQGKDEEGKKVPCLAPGSRLAVECLSGLLSGFANLRRFASPNLRHAHCGDLHLS